MASLSTSEQAFLQARQEEAARLQAAIEKAERQLAPLDDQINDLQPQLDEIYEKQRKLGQQKQEIIAAHDLVRVKNEYADVSRDITKLLKKQRNG